MGPDRSQPTGICIDETTEILLTLNHSTQLSQRRRRDKHRE